MDRIERDAGQEFSLFDSVEAHIVILDSQGRIRYLNRALRKTTGYCNQEVQDKYLWEVLVPPSKARQARDIFIEMREYWETASSADLSTPLKREHCLLTMGGEERLFEWNIKVKLGERGTAEYMVGTGCDLTERRHAEEELSKRLDRQRFVFEVTTVGIVLADVRGKIIQTNPSLQKMLDYNEQELTTMVFADFTYEEDIKSNLELFRKLVAGEIDHYQMDKRYVRRDGSLFWGNLNVSNVRNQEGEILYIIGMLEDITERKRAEENSLRLNSIIEATSDFVATADPNGRILYYNQAARLMLGIGEHDTLAKCRISDTQPPAKVPIVWEEGIPQAIRDGVWSGESLLVMPTGREIPVSQVIIAHQNADGSLGHLSTIVRDIREQLLARQVPELTRSNEELEQFAYIASHDLQEPLRMISSYVQLLARRYQGRLDSDADEFIAYAVDGTRRMQLLINDLLAYSRVTTQGRRFERVAAKEVLDQVLADLSLAIEENRAIVTFDYLPMVMADAAQLGQVLQNLLANALKYHGDEAPQIHVGVEHVSAEWIFSVQDNGIGIAEEHFARIFLVFQRLHTREEFSGTGIGLAVCKKIVERHGGRIWVRSQPRMGATFYFTIPEREDGSHE